MFVKLTDGSAERYTIHQLRRDNPSTSFPAYPPATILAEWGVFDYVATEEPAHDSATQIVEHQGYEETDGTFGDAYIVRDKTVEELAADLADARVRMSCSKMQGILTLGETKWGEVLTYRNQEFVAATETDPEVPATTWPEKMIIDSAQDWQRNSQNIAFFGQLLGYTDAQMDDLFEAAALVSA